MRGRLHLIGFGTLVAAILTGWFPLRMKDGRPLPAAVLDAVVQPALLSAVPAGLEWCPMPENTLLAATRDAAEQRRRRSPRTVDADRAPLRTIIDDRATYSAVAVDPVRGEVVLQDENLFQILVYNLNANTPPQASMTEPKRRIGGPLTKVEFNCGLYVDPKTGEIYSVPNDTVDTLVIFGRDARGNVAPDRQLATPHGTYGIAVDETKQEMFLTVQHSNSVVVYRKQAQGDEQPLREITGAATHLEDPHGIAVDPTRNLMFVVNYGNAREPGRRAAGSFQLPSITVYPLDAKGNVAPLRVIEGDRTRLNWPAGMVVDTREGILYVANDGDDSVVAFKVTDEGNVAPHRLIKGGRTGLANPTGVAVDEKANQLWVSNFSNHSAHVFPLKASGDVAPLRTIRAAPQGEKALGIGNPGAVAYDTKRREILVPN